MRLDPDTARRMAALAETDPAYAAQLAEWERLLSLEVRDEPAAMAELCSPDYVRRPHVDLMSRELARLATGQTKRLLLMTPPQVGKSSLAAVWTPLWWLALHPAHKIVIGSYGSNLAINRGRAIRRLVEEHGWRWGLELAFGSRSVNDWELISGGGIRSVGIGAGLTGFPADLGLVDDPHKGRAEADSRLMRDRVWDWWSSDFLSRLSPGAPVCIIMTPWHEDDLAHRVQAQDGTEEEGGLWRVVKLPALANDPADPLGRSEGEPLTHPLIPAEDADAALTHWRERRAQTTVRDWASLYQLDPQPEEGALVSAALVRERTHTPPPTEPVKVGVAIDPSGGGRDTAGIVGGFLGQDRRLYLTHDATVTGTSQEWGRAACLLAAQIGAEVVVFESNYGGDQARTIIRLSWAALARERPEDPRFQGLPPQVKGKHAKRGKLLRAEPVAQQIAEDWMRFGAQLPELAWEWQTWQPTDTDSPGRIDASCYLAYELLPVPGADAVVSSPAGVNRSQARQGVGVRVRRSWTP